MKTKKTRKLLMASIIAAAFSLQLSAQQPSYPNSSPGTLATVTCGTDTIAYPEVKSSGQSYVSLTKGDIEGLGQWYPRPAASTLHGLTFRANVQDDAHIGKTASLNIRIYNAGPDSLPQGLAIALTTVTIDTNLQSWRVPLLAPQALTGDFVASIEYGAGLTDNDTINFQLNAPGDGAGESLGAGIYNNGTSAVWLDFEHLISSPDRDAMIFPWVSYSLTTDFDTPGDSVCLDESLAFINTSTEFASSKIYNKRVQSLQTFGPAFDWSFGDGSTSDAKDPLKQYSATGTYSVLLTTAITGYHTQCSEPMAKSITVEPRPIASFSSSANVVQPGDTILFSNTSSGGSCSWDFGDSTAIVNDCADHNHVFDSLGTYVVTLTITSPYGCEEIQTDTISVSGAVGTNQSIASAEMKVYPNPADDFLNVSWGSAAVNTELTIFDLQGKAVLVHNTQNDLGTRLQLSNIPAGMYILQMRQDEHRESLRFIIK